MFAAVYHSSLCSVDNYVYFLTAVSFSSQDRAARMNDLVTLRREMEKESESKQEMENEIISKLQDQLMSNKAAKYFLQLASKLQKKMMDLVGTALTPVGLMGTGMLGGCFFSNLEVTKVSE